MPSVSVLDATNAIAGGGWVTQANGNTITVGSTSLTDTYTYSDGRVLTITYTDSSKATISTIARTA